MAPPLRLADYGRKKAPKPAPKADVDLEGERRLSQAAERMHASLGIGWLKSGPISTRVDEQRWECADASAQQQAARAVLNFAQTAAALRPPPHMDKAAQQKVTVCVEEAVPALEALLQSPSPAVRAKAAAACRLLAGQSSAQWLKQAPLRLLGPLCRLLCETDVALVVDAASAVEATLARVRVKATLSRSQVALPRAATRLLPQEDTLWSSLAEADPVARIKKQLLQALYGSSDAGAEAEGGGLPPLLERERCLAHTRVLAAVAHKWPAAVDVLAADPDWAAMTARLCFTHSDEIVAAAMDLASILARNGDFAKGLAAQATTLWPALASALSASSSAVVAIPALHLLGSLVASGTLGAAAGNGQLAAVSHGVVKVLRRGPLSAKEVAHVRGHLSTSSGRTVTVDPSYLQVEALHAAAHLLQWPGPHHSLLRRAGLLEALIRAGGVGPEAGQDGAKKAGGSVKLRVLTWQALRWFATFLEPAQDVKDIGPLLAVASGTYKLVLASLGPKSARCPPAPRATRDGALPHCLELATAPITPLGGRGPASSPDALRIVQWHDGWLDEAAEVCHVLLALLPCRSGAVAGAARSSLQDAVAGPHAAAFVAALPSPRLGPSSAASSSALLPSVLAVGALAEVPEFLGTGAFTWVAGILKEAYAAEVGARAQVSAEDTAAAPAPQHVEGTAGLDAEERGRWEGQCPALLAALQAVAGLLKSSDKEGIGCAGPEGQEGLPSPVRHILGQLVGPGWAPAVRCWAASALASLGVYGYPGPVGRALAGRWGDLQTADVAFVLPDGSRAPAHAVVLAARCPQLLAAFSALAPAQRTKEDSGGPPDAGARMRPAAAREAQLSAKVGPAAFRAMLEFLYAGQVTVAGKEDRHEFEQLARRCKLEALAGLMHGRLPTWGEAPAPCSLEHALGPGGWPFCDAVLQLAAAAEDSSAGGRVLNPCGAAGQHIHAHRFVLCARSEYFEALFRSGMRASNTGVVEVARASVLALCGLLRYMYTGQLDFCPIPQPCQQGCRDRSPLLAADTGPLALLHAAIELAELAEQWLLEELHGLCQAFVSRRVCPSNGLEVLEKSALHQQWGLARKAVSCLAPFYIELRASGDLERLPHEIEDLLRAAHVKLWQGK